MGRRRPDIWRGRHVFVAGAALLLTACPVTKRKGPPTFPAYDLGVSPLASDTAYLVQGATPRLYRAQPYGLATQPGTGWTDITPAGLLEAYGVEADPRVADRVFVLGYGATVFRLFRSDDRGATWSALTTGLPTAGSPGVVRVDPGTPNRVWLGLLSSNGAVLHRSDDGGQTWAPVPGYPGSNVYDVVFHPSDPSIRMARSLNEVYRSTDGGQTWAIDAAGLPAGQVYHLAADPFTADRYYAVVSSDGSGNSSLHQRSAGGTWVELTTIQQARPQITPTQVFPDPGQAGRLFVAGLGAGLLVSDDAGLSWTQRMDGTLGVRSVPYDVVFVGGDALMATLDQTYLSTGAQLRWSELNATGLQVTFVGYQSW